MNGTRDEGQVAELALQSGNATVVPASLTFAADYEPPKAWYMPQVVTITGIDGSVMDGDRPYSVTLHATSGDSQYNGLEQSVQVTTQDDDNKVLVQTINYGLSSNGKDLLVTVTARNQAGTAVAGASVDIDLYRNGVKAAAFSGTTAANGTVTFKLSNAKSGTYSTKMTSVIAACLTWDGVSKVTGWALRSFHDYVVAVRSAPVGC